MLKLYDRMVAAISAPWPESLALLFVRVVLAGIFWRSGQTKIAEDSWFMISDTTWELFRTEYSGVPLPPDLAAVLATGAEHLFPVLLVLGLFTRGAALALLGMTLVIQIFVYPDAWWTEHSLWTALALVLIVRGGGRLSIDKMLTAMRLS
jgi:putative oxidoreductase